MKPDDIPEDVINAMCLTWRHDFGLPKGDDAIIPYGMTDLEREGLRMQMRQIYQHHVLPAILAERERLTDPAFLAKHISAVAKAITGSTS